MWGRDKARTTKGKQKKSGGLWGSWLQTLKPKLSAPLSINHVELKPKASLQRQISMVTLPLKSLFFSLSSCTTLTVCLHFHSGMIKTNCLCCWLATTIIQCLAEDFFIWCYCCRSISADPSEEFIPKPCGSLCWHLLMMCLFLPLQPCSSLVCKSDSFLLLSSKLSQKCITIHQARKQCIKHKS